MRISLFLLGFLLVFPVMAQANVFERFFGDLSFTEPRHAPYLDAEKIPHQNQYYDDNWSPADWIDDRGSAQAVIDGFYEAGVLTDQFDAEDYDPESERPPFVEVGQPFLRLSQLEQRRILTFFDATYQVTSLSHGVFEVLLERPLLSTRPLVLAVYTPAGVEFR